MGLTKMVMVSRKHESGAVSLFIVIFAMLLITVVTVSFLRIMLNDQQQAIRDDLSNSAYDSALAGVEDAKRALINYRTICQTEAGDDPCIQQAARINNETCNAGLVGVVAFSGSDANPGEVLVQQSQSANDTVLDQAYTCVLMQLQTDDYLGTLAPNTSRIIPIKTTGDVQSVVLEWFMTDDLAAGSTVVNLPSSTPVTDPGGAGAELWPLQAQSNWPQNRPPVMRAQLMQVGETFTVGSFDNVDDNKSNANTMFLYPTGQTGTVRNELPVYNFMGVDQRRTGSKTPQDVICSGNLSGGGYACRVQLDLPEPINGSYAPDSRTTYIRLTSFYKSTHFRLSPMNTQFDSVQPSIDSTGRAADQFRRVETRVDLIDTTFPFPEAAVDVTGSLCKNFTVTDTENNFSASCTP